MILDSTAVQKLLKSQIHKHLSIKDWGEIQSILGIEVICDRQACTISLSHLHYINDIVNQFCQTNAKDVHSPIKMSTHLTQAVRTHNPIANFPKSNNSIKYNFHVTDP